MINKKHQVFISSTYKDLKDERQSVMHTLLSAGCIPAGMELFPPIGDEPWTVIERVLENCDYYLLIIGGRYGSIFSRLNISYTEAEYELAQRKNIPIIPLILDIKPEEIDALLPEKKDDYDIGRSKLIDFRNKLLIVSHPGYWKIINDLPGLVFHGLKSAQEDYPKPGWVRGYSVHALKPKNSHEYKNFRERFKDIDSNSDAVKAISEVKFILDLFLKRGNNDWIDVSSFAESEKKHLDKASSFNLLELADDKGNRVVRVKYPWSIEELQAVYYTEELKWAKEKQKDSVLRYTPKLPDLPSKNWWDSPLHNVLAHIAHICSKANANGIISDLISLAKNHPEALHLARQILITEPGLRPETIRYLLRQEDWLATVVSVNKQFA